MLVGVGFEPWSSCIFGFSHDHVVQFEGSMYQEMRNFVSHPMRQFRLGSAKWKLRKSS